MHLSKVRMSQLCIPRPHFNPKAFEESIRQLKFANCDKYSIKYTINKFLPNTIIDFTRLSLLQSYLLPIIAQRDLINLFNLYYES